VSASRRDWGGRIVGIGYKRLRQGIGVLACGVVFGGVAGNAAAQGPPSPQPSRSPVHPTIRPDPAPGAQSSTRASTTSVPASSPTISTPSSASTLPVYAPGRAIKPVHTVKHHTRIHRAKTRSAPRVDTRPIRSLASWAWRGELLATSAATPSSGTNFLLLFVGLALVLLTIGETTFLRRAARAPRPRRRTDEQLAVHRVQLRR
jgi:hypothetical protein